MYVDNYQNNVYDKEIMILFLTRIELLPINCLRPYVYLQLTSIYRHSMILTHSRSEAETKRNTCNNFTKSLQYDTLVTYEKVTKVSYYKSHINQSNFIETPA